MRSSVVAGDGIWEDTNNVVYLCNPKQVYPMSNTNSNTTVVSQMSTHGHEEGLGALIIGCLELVLAWNTRLEYWNGLNCCKKPFS